MVTLTQLVIKNKGCTHNSGVQIEQMVNNTKWIFYFNLHFGDENEHVPENCANSFKQRNFNK